MIKKIAGRDFLEKCKVGQTKAASYGMTFKVPHIQKEKLKNDVIEKIQKLLCNIEKADAEKNETLLFLEEDGFDVEVCQIVKEMLEKVDLDFTSSISLPEKKEKEVVIKRRSIDVVNKAYDILLKGKTEENTTIRGYVVSVGIDTDKVIKDDFTIKSLCIKIKGKEDGPKKQKTYEAIISLSNYNTASLAQKNKYKIVISGTLVKFRNKKIIKNVIRFDYDNKG